MFQIVREGDTRGDLTGDPCLTIDLSGDEYESLAIWNEDELTCDIRSSPISSSPDLISRFQNAIGLISENIDVKSVNSKKSTKKKKKFMITLVTRCSCDFFTKKQLMEEAEKQ